MEQCIPFGLSLFSSLTFDCFALDKNAIKYFGFAEFISGLALTLVVWTVADLRYKFRIDTASLPVRSASLVITPFVGSLTLLTDYWRSSQSRVPAGGWLTPESWQLLLAGTFLFILIVWFWYAFFRPAKFNKCNCSKFTSNVETYLLRGYQSELAIIGDELARTVSNIVQYAPDDLSSDKVIKIQINAFKLLMAMGSPKFCRAIVEGSPKLIINLFHEVEKQKKYNDAVRVIAKNVITAAIENRNSFLYNEQNFFESGLEGITRPVTTVLSNSPELIDKINTLLSPDYSRRAPWDIEQWKAYLWLLLEVFTVYVRERHATSCPKSLHLAYLQVKKIYVDLTEDLQLINLNYGSDLYTRLKMLGSLIKDMVAVLNKLAQPADYAEQNISNIIYSLITSASSVRKPRIVSRKIQYTLIWSYILNSSELRSEAGIRILNQVHRKLLDEIKKAPNLDSLIILGYCLNVMGFNPPEENEPYGSSWRKLHIELLDWVKVNIAPLIEEYPDIVRYCFVDGMSFDEKNNRIVIQHVREDGEKTKPQYLNVEPATKHRRRLIR
ncbi:hypothetical protein ABN239_06185 [Providencia vermicola]|uniref:hypothetical protein n=1 Tax=Providencia vermicola TaxID=333965 RepID=UPI0032DBE290